MISILITRPLFSAHRLAEKIKAETKHIQPVIFPVIEIIDADLPLDLSCISCIDMIIFISPIAVEKSGFSLSKLRDDIKIFAIGKGTAEKIQQHDWRGEVIFPQAKFNSEALLDLNELKEIKNKKILICKGEGGNTLLSETLRARGANVRKINVYKRILPKPAALPDLNMIDLILCTSQESMNNLICLLGESVKQKRLLVSSEKLKTLAKTLGFKLTPLLAENAGDTALINAMIGKIHQIRT
jgi:uroporphyrinogen-III synthase